MDISKAIRFANSYASTKLLKKTKFWKGSFAELEHRHCGIRLASIDRMIKELKLVEEVGLTEDEKEFLEALQETWDNDSRYYERIV
jgi:hypothetical protein